MSDQERKLRCIAMNDETVIASILELGLETQDASAMDAKTHALVRLAALIVVDAAPPTYQWATEGALSAGASDEEIIGTLITVAPVVGAARVVSAAPEIAIALGYPIDAALEALTEPAKVEKNVSNARHLGVVQASSDEITTTSK